MEPLEGEAYFLAKAGYTLLGGLDQQFPSTAGGVAAVVIAARKRPDFELTLTANNWAVMLTLIANGLRLSANGSQTGG